MTQCNSSEYANSKTESTVCASESSGEDKNKVDLLCVSVIVLSAVRVSDSQINFHPHTNICARMSIILERERRLVAYCMTVQTTDSTLTLTLTDRRSPLFLCSPLLFFARAVLCVCCALRGSELLYFLIHPMLAIAITIMPTISISIPSMHNPSMCYRVSTARSACIGPSHPQS